MTAFEGQAWTGAKRALRLAPDPFEERVSVEETRARTQERPSLRDWAALAIVGGSFLVAATAFLSLPSSRSPAPWQTVFVVGMYAIASRFEYEVGIGSVVPTQLILVPMLFFLPLGWVPFAVLGGLLAGSVIDVALGRLAPLRVFLTIPDAWHAVGPVAVLALAGEQPLRLNQTPIYIAAFVAQVVVELVAFAGRDWIARGISPRSQIVYTARTVPFDASLAPLGLAVACAAGRDPLALLLALPPMFLLSLYAHERRAGLDSALELSRAYRGTALLLGDVIESDDSYTGLHSRDVVELSLAVATELRLPQRERRDVEFTALLHDIGKIKIPEHIIGKRGALTPEERAAMETHTVEGQRMLEQVGGLLGSVGHLVRSCHERWDGTGYPDRLAATATPLVARIVAACDAFSAMTTDRPYRGALSVEAAADELRDNAGTQFDPIVVSALIDVIRRGTVPRPPLADQVRDNSVR